MRCIEARVRVALLHWTEVNERVEGVLGRESAAALRALADHAASDDFLAAYESARANEVSFARANEVSSSE